MNTHLEVISVAPCGDFSHDYRPDIRNPGKLICVICSNILISIAISTNIVQVPTPVVYDYYC